MRDENSRLTLISAVITIVALIGIIVHIMMPEMMIDNITLGLLVIAILPWFVPVIRSIKWGNLEVDLQDRVEKLEVDTKEMHTEMEKMAQTVNEMKDGKVRPEPSPITGTVPPTAAFVHIADQKNTVENFTIIDNRLTNSNPNAILMVTQNWIQPTEEENGVYNSHPIGVW